MARAVGVLAVCDRADLKEVVPSNYLWTKCLMSVLASLLTLFCASLPFK